MPTYEYLCEACGFGFSKFVPIKDRDSVLCSACLSRRLKRVPQLVGLSSGRRCVPSDAVKREMDMRDEMRTQYGVDNFKPLRGSTTKQVYDDIKKQGSYIPESMKAESEKREKINRDRSREWTRSALKRYDRKVAEIKERRAEKESKKRAITL